jgi:hypothetical protein
LKYNELCTYERTDKYASGTRGYGLALDTFWTPILEVSIRARSEPNLEACMPSRPTFKASRRLLNLRYSFAVAPFSLDQPYEDGALLVT